MIFETTVEKLMSAVEGADRVTARNASLPALANILILVSGKVVKIRATNLSLGVEFELPVKAEKDGIIALDGKTLAAFLATQPKNEKIRLSLEGTTLSVKSAAGRTNIKTHPYEDFPTLPAISGVQVTIPKAEFVRGVKYTAFAAATSDVKPEISSVYLYVSQNTLYFVATDSFRLAERKENLKKAVEFPPIIVPFKNIVEMARVAEALDGDLSLTVNENQISLTAPGIYLTSRIVSGSFPDYKQIIPKEFLTDVVVLKQDLLSALKAATIFSDRFNQITLAINPSKKSFTCVSKNSDVGEYDGSIGATLSGDDVTIALNQRYLADVLSLIPQDSVSLGLNGAQRAVVIRGVSDTAFTYLLMPMNR